MDEKRIRILLGDLRATGKLVNKVGEQYWHEDIKEEKEIRW